MTTVLTTLAQRIHAENRDKGFWDNPRPLTETTMLIVTELAEAVEEDRAGRTSVYLSRRSDDSILELDEAEFDGYTGLFRTSDSPEPLKPEGIDVELVDALIRLLDLLGSRGTDVDQLLADKLNYNASRAHKHGKAY